MELSDTFQVDIKSMPNDVKIGGSTFYNASFFFCINECLSSQRGSIVMQLFETCHFKIEKLPKTIDYKIEDDNIDYYAQLICKCYTSLCIKIWKGYVDEYGKKRIFLNSQPTTYFFGKSNNKTVVNILEYSPSLVSHTIYGLITTSSLEEKIQNSLDQTFTENVNRILNISDTEITKITQEHAEILSKIQSLDIERKKLEQEKEFLEGKLLLIKQQKESDLTMLLRRQN